MEWKIIESDNNLTEIKTASSNRPQVIFKHSTRCSISKMALSRLERNEPVEGIDFHILDLLQHRLLSNKIAEDFKIAHESPQVLLIDNGKCIYDASHSAISMEEIAEHINQAS